MTAGVLSVNPNTMYPLLRRLESRGLIEGRWEHPERRTRRYYSLTMKGRKEYERLRGGGAAVPRLRLALDRRDRARGVRLMARRGRRGARWRSTPTRRWALDRPRPLGHLRRGVRARGGARASWPAEGAKVVWESNPDGRGRVTEKVIEHGPGLIRTQRLRGAPGGRPDGPLRRRPLPARARLRPDRRWTASPASPTCSSSGARCATRSAAPSPASPSRRRTRPGSGRLPPRRQARNLGGPCTYSKPPSSARAPWAGRSPR